MSVRAHIETLKQGAEAWAQFRKESPALQPELLGADLREADLSRFDLTDANLIWSDLSGASLSGARLFNACLTGANLVDAKLVGADLSKVNLSRADLSRADLSRANLSGADLCGAKLVGAKLAQADLGGSDLTRANLRGADLTGAYLSGTIAVRADFTEAELAGAFLSTANFGEASLVRANLQGAILVETNLEQANLSGSRIYGISAWRPRLQGARQFGLVITQPEEPSIAVDDLEMAQFLSLLLQNGRLRELIELVPARVVLVVGNFGQKRRSVLEAIQEGLRSRAYLPVVFDLENPRTHAAGEPLPVLARLARFILVDLTEESSASWELAGIARTVVAPIRPLLNGSDSESPGHVDLPTTWHWVLPIYRYTDRESLLAGFSEGVIAPSEKKLEELTQIAPRPLGEARLPGDEAVSGS